jgi:hypothetical protein
MTVREPGNRIAAIGATVIGALGAGWFILSHFVMKTATTDALGEAVGVMLALLVVASVIGAVMSTRGNHR